MRSIRPTPSISARSPRRWDRRCASATRWRVGSAELLIGCRTDGVPGAIDQMVVAEYFRTEFDAHIKKLTGTLREKHDVLIEAPAQEFGTAVEITPTTGGIYLWVKPAGRRRRRKLFAPAPRPVSRSIGPEWAWIELVEIAYAAAMRCRARTRSGALRSWRGCASSRPEFRAQRQRCARPILGELMIDLYTWSTPNGRKISIALEELRPALHGAPDRHRQGRAVRAGLPQDHAPTTASRRSSTATTTRSLMEIGAILIYLAEKTGKLLPKRRRKRASALIEWLMWQMGGIGPMLGQAHHFLKYNHGQGALCRGALPQGSEAALRRAGPAAGEGRDYHGRRLFDRRYRDLAVDFAFRMAGHRSQRLSEREALVWPISPRARPCRRAITCPSIRQRHPDAEVTRRCRNRRLGRSGWPRPAWAVRRQSCGAAVAGRPVRRIKRPSRPSRRRQICRLGRFHPARRGVISPSKNQPGAMTWLVLQRGRR